VTRLAEFERFLNLDLFSYVRSPITFLKKKNEVPKFDKMVGLHLGDFCTKTSSPLGCQHLRVLKGHTKQKDFILIFFYFIGTSFIKKQRILWGASKVSKALVCTAIM
jgi:hypothetical protein